MTRYVRLDTFSTSQVAKRLGIGIKTLSRYIAENKVPAPQIFDVGGRKVHVWNEAYRNQCSSPTPAEDSQRQENTILKTKEKQKPPAGAVPHKSRKPKKK